MEDVAKECNYDTKQVETKAEVVKIIRQLDFLMGIRNWLSNIPKPKKPEPVVTYSQVTWKYKEEDGYHGEYDIEYESAQSMYTELIENEFYALEWVVWEKVINDGEDFEDIERWDNSIE